MIVYNHVRIFVPIGQFCYEFYPTITSLLRDTLYKVVVGPWPEKPYSHGEVLEL